MLRWTLNRSIEWAPDMDGPLPPLVDERGQVWVTAEGAIVGFDANGARIPGRYEPETGFIVYDSDCAHGDTGCQSWMEPPVMAPRGLVYSLETAPEPTRAAGSRSSTRTAAIRSGWPIILQRDGARFGERDDRREPRRIRSRPVEPEPGDRISLSILAFAPNSTRELGSPDRRTVDAGTLAARRRGKHSEVFTGRICQTAHWCVRFGRDRPCLWAGPGSVGRAAPSPSRDRPQTVNRRSLEVVAHA